MCLQKSVLKKTEKDEKEKANLLETIWKKAVLQCDGLQEQLDKMHPQKLSCCEPLSTRSILVICALAFMVFMNKSLTFWYSLLDVFT
jgi:hypothetical protein